MRTRGRLESPEDFNAIVVAQRPTGPIYLRDVALVEDGMADERSLSRLNGVRAVSLLIRRQSGTNTVAGRPRREGGDRRAPGQPAGGLHDGHRRRHVDVHRGVDRRRASSTWCSAALLAVLVIFLFLRNVTSTMISAVAIPTSIVGTFTFVSALGFTVNFMTMLALSLSVGMLIDDAIVVIENIYRHMEDGMHRREAAEFGTSEIGLAVMATTFSIVAVFVPVAFMNGIDRPVLLPVRHDGHVRRAHLAVRVVHAHADAVVARS